MYYIYLIVNKVNGKTYIGQRKSLKEWYEDKYLGIKVKLVYFQRVYCKKLEKLIKV